MMTPAHFFGGYVALQVSKKFWRSPQLTSFQSRGLLIFGLLFSIVIDMDVLLTGGIGGHHKQLTHYPFFWLLFTMFIFGLGLLFRKRLVKSLAIVIFIASWTHMALDLVGVTMGIHWFWPFSLEEFSVTPLRESFISEQERWGYILRSPVMWVGDSIVVLGGMVKMGCDLMKKQVKI